ncbi:MAG TPA: DNA methyltransferase [Patescibacteria group bacterium]|nr:DNA methyltransferase [Patescibacteria group bacterium]
MTYLFFLGRQQDLAQVELQAVLARFLQPTEILEIIPGIFSAELDSSELPERMMKVLGGTVKIAEQIDVIPTANTPEVEERAIQYLSSDAFTKRRVFSFAEQNRNHLDAVSQQNVKKALVKRGLSVRYVETPREGAEAGLLLEGDVTELQFIHTGAATVFARTVAVQYVHDWSARDMEKPYRDKKKGMIPPKLGRTLLNLAFGAENPEGKTVLDPFCGTGTILMEARVLGAHVVGSDQDKEAVHGAGKNLQWLTERFSLPEDSIRLSVQDATQITDKETGGKVDCIVTEPFLGKPNPTLATVDNMLKGLERLYLGSCKQWLKLLKPNGRVVIVFPYVQFGKRVKSMEPLIDRLESLGYTREKGPYIYTKPYAIVQRAVYVFRLKE